MEVMVTTGAITRVQSASQIITTNKPTCMDPDALPVANQQSQSTEGGSSPILMTL